MSNSTLFRSSSDAPSESPSASQLDPALAPTHIIDCQHPVVREFALLHTGGAQSAKESAIRLYYAVRDGIRYDPYEAAITPDTLRASAALAAGRGWCVSKAVLLAAACRAVGIPARLGFADVRNHLSTARMREHMKTDVFYWHGYTSIAVGEGGRWVKATPAFNIELCEKFGFLALEFDGENDSLYQPLDREGRRHMEYVNERGQFDDVPLDEIRATFAEVYPFMDLDSSGSSSALGEEADFDRDVEAEVTAPGSPARSL
ncbi:MAG: transglutaminase family protein [Deltaproteobacteria bacterium]|nr:transglutaminase family protein [Deltaproteobacteria bacterium]